MYLVLIVCLMATCRASVLDNWKGSRYLSSGNSSCNFTGSIEMYLRSTGIDRLDVEVKNGTICGTEWNLHGTCCNEHSVKALITKTAVALAGADKSFKEYIDHMKELINKTVVLTNNPSLSSHLETLAAIQETLPVNHKKCFQSQEEYVSNLFCKICSSRHALWFKGDNMTLYANDCVALSKDCSDSWKQYAQLVSIWNAGREAYAVKGVVPTDNRPETYPNAYLTEFFTKKIAQVISLFQLPADDLQTKAILDEASKIESGMVLEASSRLYRVCVKSLSFWMSGKLYPFYLKGFSGAAHRPSTDPFGSLDSLFLERSISDNVISVQPDFDLK